MANRKEGLMSSWIGWLLILGAIYLLVLLIRGLIDLVRWVMEAMRPEPVKPRGKNNRRTQSPQDSG
jgi:hypothetical protein